MRFSSWIRRLFTGESRVVSEFYDDDDDNPNADLFNPFPDTVEIPLADVLDLHTIQPRDVKRVVEEYLYQVHCANFAVVRIIHGKGVGVQRELVRSILARTSYVYDWTDAPADAGGLGATIVRLKASS